MSATDASSERTAAPARALDLASSEVDPERVALGLAVQARAEEIGRAGRGPLQEDPRERSLRHLPPGHRADRPVDRDRPGRDACGGVRALPPGREGHPRGRRARRRGEGLLRVARRDDRHGRPGGHPPRDPRRGDRPRAEGGPPQLRRQPGPDRPAVRPDPPQPPATAEGRAGHPRPPGAPRRADRARQPHPAHRPAPPRGRRARPQGNSRDGPLPRPRQPEGGQRPVRPLGRRLAPLCRRGPAPRAGALERHRGPARRRRVRGADRGRRGPGPRRTVARGAHPPGHAPADPARRAEPAHLGQHRHRTGGAGAGSRGLSRPGRRRDVRGETWWTGTVRVLQRRDRQGQPAQEPAR